MSMAKASPEGAQRTPPTGRPDLIRGRLFGVWLLLLFLVLLLLLTVGRSKIRAPLWPLLTQRLPRLQAQLLKTRLLPIAQAWAAVGAGGPCRGRGPRGRGQGTHTDTPPREVLCPWCVG